MRKLSWLLVSSIFCFPLAVFCQQPDFGITAGLAVANMQAKFGGASATSDNKAGITAGVFADIDLPGQFSFQPALSFVQKGYTAKSPGSENKLTLNYLELPLKFPV